MRHKLDNLGGVPSILSIAMRADHTEVTQADLCLNCSICSEHLQLMIEMAHFSSFLIFKASLISAKPRGHFGDVRSYCFTSINEC